MECNYTTLGRVLRKHIESGELGIAGRLLCDVELPEPDYFSAHPSEYLKDISYFYYANGEVRRLLNEMRSAMLCADKGLLLSPSVELYLLKAKLTLMQGYESADGFHKVQAEARVFLNRAVELIGGGQSLDPAAGGVALEVLKLYFSIGMNIGFQNSEEHRRVVSVLRRQFPDNEAYKDAEAEISNYIEPTKGKVKLSRYPDHQRFSADYREILRDLCVESINPKRFVKPETRFFCIGSCFAREIGIHLIKSGYSSFISELGEFVNNTFTNLALLEYVLEGKVNPANRDSLDFILQGCGGKSAFLAQFDAADVIIFTLGVAPAFFDTDGQPAIFTDQNSKLLTFARAHRFRTTHVQENLDNLRRILALLTRGSKPKQIVISLSPVPLKASFEYTSAIQADCVSKSILRATLHELQQEAGEQFIYWPSFELVRWVSGHKAPVFGVDDGAANHVSFKVVEAIVREFIAQYSVA